MENSQGRDFSTTQGGGQNNAVIMFTKNFYEETILNIFKYRMTKTINLEIPQIFEIVELYIHDFGLERISKHTKVYIPTIVQCLKTHGFRSRMRKHEKQLAALV
jgi:hypothetical protein